MIRAMRRHKHLKSSKLLNKVFNVQHQCFPSFYLYSLESFTDFSTTYRILSSHVMQDKKSA